MTEADATQPLHVMQRRVELERNKAINNVYAAHEAPPKYCKCPPEKNCVICGTNGERVDRPMNVRERHEAAKALLDGQTVTNEAGGKQSFLSAAFHCIPYMVLRLLAQCLGFGARKYGKENWKKIPIEEHASHAMNHLNEWMIGDRSEPHLVNALARTSFALQLAIESGEQPTQYIHPDMVSHE